MLRYGYPYGTNENVCICENHPTQQIIRQGPVVRRPISANPGLDFNLGFFIPLL